MKISDRVRLELVEVRKRSLELAEIDEPTDEHRAEAKALMGKSKSLEERYQLALVGEAEEDKAAAASGDVNITAEDRELMGMETRASLGRYFDSVIEERALDGVELELNQALKIDKPGRFPLRLLAPPPGQEIEHRADAETSLAFSNAVRPTSWTQRLFRASVMGDLGIMPTMMEPGASSHVITTAGGAGATVAKGATSDAVAYTATPETLTPERHSLAYLVHSVDMYRIPDMNENLRADLASAIVDSMGNEVLNGSPDAKTITGILNDVTPLTISGSADAALSGATSAQDLVKGAMTLVDGRHAVDPSELRMLVSPECFAYFMSLVDSGGNNLRGPVLANLRTSMFGLQSKATDFISVTSDADEYYVVFSRLRGLASSSALPIWADGEIQTNPYSNENTGQTKIRISAFWNFKVLRASSFPVRRVAVA